MPDSNTRAIAVKIDQETRERIKRLAESRQRTSHWLMREAIGQYLDREEKREMVRKSSIETWEECRTTGLHVTGDEVITWLVSWGDEDEKPAPLYHK